MTINRWSPDTWISTFEIDLEINRFSGEDLYDHLRAMVVQYAETRGRGFALTEGPPHRRDALGGAVWRWPARRLPLEEWPSLDEWLAGRYSD